ncbi:MAG: Gfo/Idh/MocA family oxidoreductase [Verrucomicrobia bacterium]|nr:Gfo/Idh/MocA family oxidoreductase [Verrucomicrobiota bacterium]
MNRRDFLRKTSTATVAAFGLGPGLRGAPASPSSTLRLGLIGTGDRGSALLGEILALAKPHNVQVVALCDVWRKNREAAAAKVQAHQGAAPRAFSRYQELLELAELDAVTIATPDFGHGPILVAALEAGKDVYVEKPMSLDLALANRALELARAQARVVQAGTQRRSDPRQRGAAKALAAGVLGTLSRVSVAMNFNQPRWARAYQDCLAADVDWPAFLMHLPTRPFDARLLRRWHHSKECTNGLSGLWMSHYTDAVSQLTGAPYPASAVAHGGLYVWKDGREHTDTFHALLDYPEGFLFSWAMGLGNSAGVHFTVHGTLGTLDAERWTLSPEGGANTKLEAAPVVPEPCPSHMENWLTCLRSRERPSADIQCGHQHAVATIMAAAALETGRRQVYHPATRTVQAG